LFNSAQQLLQQGTFSKETKDQQTSKLLPLRFLLSQCTWLVAN
jgi:hypothetical protein